MAAIISIRQPGDDPETALKRAATRRWQKASDHKSQFSRDLSEAYFFTNPTAFRDMTASQPSNVNDRMELATSIGMECAEDFATLIMTTFFPGNENWAARTVKEPPPDGKGINPDELAKLTQDIEDVEARVFEEIRSSNLVDELAAVCMPDAAIGTVAIHIDTSSARSPIRALGVPLTDIFCTVGPDGTVDNRFINKHSNSCDIWSDLPELKTSSTAGAALWRKKIAEKKDGGELKMKVRWGWWRDWEAHTETWQHIVQIDEDVIVNKTISGEGCCPLLIGRFGKVPKYAFGNGPTLKSLPELRKLDEQRIMMVEALDHIIRPPITYPRDSYADIEHGVESGKAYPIDPQEKDAIRPFYEPKGLDAAYFDEEKSERRIKTLHYIDKPEQRGDTPPTLGQWMSEMELGQRRFGVPGKTFWREMPRAIFLRFLYILEQRGVVKKLKVREQDLITEAVNPSQRAQDMQNIANASRFLEISLQAFPEEAKVKIDGGATMENMREKMGVKDIVAMRKPQDIQATAQLIAPLISGQAGTVAPQGAGPPAPVPA